jgi:hypothetical protein
MYNVILLVDSVNCIDPLSAGELEHLLLDTGSKVKLSL